MSSSILSSSVASTIVSSLSASSLSSAVSNSLSASSLSNIATSSLSTSSLSSSLSASSLSSTVASSLSSTSSVSKDMVEGVRYESRVYGIGAPSFDTTNIFIGSMELLLSKDGHASRSNVPTQSKKSAAVMQKYLDKCNRKDHKFDNEEFEAVRKKAEGEDKEKVQIPLELVNKINTLVEEELSLEARRKAIQKSIADLTKQIFKQ